MGTSVGIGNINKPAPAWFIKTKNAVSILSDAAVVILLTSGIAKDNSLLILYLRVGISAVMNALNSIFADDSTTKQ